MTGYVFHCSRCKFDHAGECSGIDPKAVVRAPVIVATFDPKSRIQLTPNAASTRPGKTYQPGCLGGRPIIGSRWSTQDQNSDGSWGYTFKSVYVVTGISGDRVSIQEEGGGYATDSHHEAWTTDGMQGSGWRWAPADPPKTP